MNIELYFWMFIMNSNNRETSEITFLFTSKTQKTYSSRSTIIEISRSQYFK